MPPLVADPDPDALSSSAAEPSVQMHEVLQQLSHDIRSAMSDVIGGLRLVEIDRVDPQTQTQIVRVRAAADTLAALVDDALLTASGETRVKHTDTYLVLSDWLSALAGRWKGRAAERGSRLEIRRIGRLPQSLIISPLVLDRIVGNLVGNALVHVPGGDVEVEVLADPIDGLTICIRDEGPGFPLAVLDSFQSSGRAVPTGSTGGSGLGLRIASGLTAAAGAELTLSNDAATGTGMAVLRIPPELVTWTGGVPAPCTPPNLSGLRILVAEDNLTNQMILRQMLEKMQAETVFVGDGLAALDALQQERFDIGLIDIEMPRKSGLEVMEQVRRGQEPLASIPLVAITAYVLRDNREAIYAAGADGIIGKPIASGEEFGRAILRYVGRPSDAQPLPGELDSSNRHQKLDRARFDRLLDEAGQESRAELLDRLVEDLNSVRDGLKAGVATASIPEIRAQTHILIAISGAVGADRLCQLSEILNIAAKRRRTEQLLQIYQPVRADLDDLLAVIEAARR